MTSLDCPVSRCGRTRAGHQTVCGACQGDLARALADVPALARELDVTVSRQGSRSGGRPGGSTQLPYDARASAAGHHLHATLVTWVRLLLDGIELPQPIEGPTCKGCIHDSCTEIRRVQGVIWFATPPADTLPAIGRWLRDRQPEIIRHHAAQEAVEGITAAVRAVERAVDRPADRWYAGQCGADTPAGPCARDLYARPGAPAVTCPECDARWDVQERREWLLKAAEDVLLYGAAIAQALTALAHPVTPELIRQWAHRGRLAKHGTDEAGRPQFRIGDVMDLVAQDAQRRQAKRDKVAS